MVGAPPAAVWAVVGDPYRLPSWWPRSERVEGAADAAWTLVLRTPRGRVVRADQRLVASEPERRQAWELVVAGTPFERLVRESSTEVRLAPAGAGTSVTLAGRQTLRGMNRLGTPLVRRALARELDAALAALAGVVAGPDAPSPAAAEPATG
jgi:uncharacterized protein YndB with AHSA1/START domain